MRRPARRASPTASASIGEADFTFSYTRYAVVLGFVLALTAEARAPQPTAALGANLLGAVLGGGLEYYSMLGGLKSTALMALALYLVAYLLIRRRESAGRVSAWESGAA